MSELIQDAEDPCEEWYLARFRAHLEPCGDERLNDAPLEEALGWAAARADVTVVQVAGCYQQFWAGDRPPPKSWRLAPLPSDALALERRRPAGRAWCDRREGDPPVLWPVAVTFAGTAATVATLERSGGVERVRRIPNRSGRSGAVAARLLVFAVTRAEAERRARAACTGAGGEVLDASAGPPAVRLDEGGPDRYTSRRWGLTI